MNIFIKIFVFILYFFHLTFANAQQTLVQIDKGVETNLNQTVPVIGTVISNKNSVLMASLPGKVSKLFFKEGDFIQKGKLIARIDYEKYKWVYEKAKASVKIYEAKYNNAKTETVINSLELSRMKALKNSSAFNKAKFDTLTNLHKIKRSNEIKALAELETSKYNSDIALLNLQNSEIRAIYSGVLEEKFIEEGEVVNAGTKMFNLISKEDLEIIAEIPTLRVKNLSLKNKVTAITTDNFQVPTIIRAIGAKENSITRTIKVFLTFNKIEQKRSLFVGENITLEIPIGEGKKAITIHKDAILKREGISLAYVVKNNKVEIRPLKLGEAVNNRFIVYNGVKLNELVVIKGNERLRPGQEVNYKNIE